MPLNTGTILKQRYRVARLLGQGGFGAVYRAWDIALNRPCALKENLDISPQAQRQFTREAQILAKLAHPNLPRVTDYFQIPNQGQYLVMDFVEGEDLESLVAQQGALAPQEALRWIGQIAAALAYMHAQSPPVIHRDIKPANVIITPQGQAMLVDFGLVKVYDPHLRTTMGARAVTPGYAPPEQYGRGNTDVRTDIYALAATLYTLLTGLEPQESVQRIVDDRMQPPDRVRPGVPAQVGAALTKALALTPTERFQSVEAFQKALTEAEALPGGQTVIARPPRSAPQETTAWELPAPAPPAGRREAPAPAPSRRRYWYAGGAMLLVLLAFLLWRVIDAGSTPQVVEVTRIEEVIIPITATPGRAATVAAQQTGTAAAAAATSAVQATATARTGATATERARRDAAATATRQGFFDMLTALENASVLTLGPVDGELPHDEEDFIEVYVADVQERDFVTEAVFLNPYARSVGEWDYGFLFRWIDDQNNYRLWVDSDSRWGLTYYDGVDFNELGGGTLSDFNNDAGGRNLLELIADGERGYFFVNDKFIAELDLSAETGTGDIYPATGLNAGNKTMGEVTRFLDFTVRALTN